MIGGSARLGRLATAADDLRVVREGHGAGRALGQELRPHRRVELVALGDPGRGRVEAEQGHRPGAVGELRGDHAVARRREHAPGTLVARVGGDGRRARGRGADDRAQRRRIDVELRGRPIGEQVVRERGQRVRARGAADDDQLARPRRSRSGARRAGRCVRAEASVSCQISRSMADQAWIRSGRSAGVSVAIDRRHAVLVGRQVELADDLGRVLGRPRPRRAAAGRGWPRRRVPRRARTRRPRAGPSCCRRTSGGSAYRRYCLREPVASSTGVENRVRESAPPVIRSSPLTVGPAFARSTATANQEPGTDVALEQRAGGHRQAVLGRRRPGRRRPGAG